jgi:NRPS condensation-like uncharacterized protein
MSPQDDCFPLDLSDFEYYTFRDDSVDHPMVIVLRFHLQGTLDAEVFQASLTETLHHNPLLRCRIDQTGRRLRWVPVEDASPRLDCTWHNTVDPPTDCPTARFDLTKESGARFELRISPQKSVLVVWFHHACVDGIGAIRFLADVFAVYGQRTANTEADSPRQSVPAPEILQLRGQCPSLNRADGTGKNWVDWLKGPSRFLFGRNYCIPSHGITRYSDCGPRNVLHSAVLPRKTFRQLKQLATSKQVSTNDLCMMVYLQQICDWTEADTNARDTDLLRILMPVTMRTPDHDAISAANVLSYVFQPFRRIDCRNPETLLAAIHTRTVDMIHSNEGAVLLKLLSIVRRVPGLFRLSQWLQPSFATAVLANVGELKRVFGSRFPMKKGRVVAGNVIIQQIDGIAPLRKNTNVAISFGGYGGELTLNLRANTQALSEADAMLFLDQVVSRLTALADSQSLTAPIEQSSEQDSTRHHGDSFHGPETTGEVVAA